MTWISYPVLDGSPKNTTPLGGTYPYSYYKGVPPPPPPPRLYAFIKFGETSLVLVQYPSLLFHYYVILPYKDKRTRKIWERITL